MINKTAFKAMRKELEKYDKSRESLIIKSREALKNSKSAIYALHRYDKGKAGKLLRIAKNRLGELKRLVKKEPRLLLTGTYNDALEEYCEAELYSGYVRNKKLPTARQLNVNVQTYLGALCDLIGELVRKAINDAIKGKYKSAIDTRKFAREIYHELNLFDWRNLPIRRKYDSVKYSMEKIEDLVLKIKLKG